MAKSKDPDELQEIIDRFSSATATPHEARLAILVLARRLKALEDRLKTGRNPKA